MSLLRALLSPGKWWRERPLRKEIAQHNAWANKQMAAQVISDPAKGQPPWTEAHRLFWVKHLVSKGACPNFRLDVSERCNEVGRYPALKRKRSIVSLSLIYPSITSFLVENGAVFDRCAMEAALYIINLDEFKRRAIPAHAWDMGTVSKSIEALFSASTITAPLRRQYVDLSDMSIKPAYEILAKLYPPARAYVERESLSEKTIEVEHPYLPGGRSRL